MSYSIKNSAGQSVATVPDGKIDKTSTSLALIGYKATNYGLASAENFIYLLENFASDVPPDNPITGQIWFDSQSNIPKVYNGTTWAQIAGIPSVTGDPTQGGVAGAYHCKIGTASALLLFAGGNIIAVVINQDLAQAAIPATVSIGSTVYPFQSLFAFGLQAGVNLADANDENNPNDYVFAGRVPLSEQAHFAGGGADDAEVSGWGYMDLGPGKSVGLMISCGDVVAAVSSTYIVATDLPDSLTFYVKKERDIGTGSNGLTGEYKGLDTNYNQVTISGIRSKFPGKDYRVLTTDSSGNLVSTSTIPNVALYPGLTFALKNGTDLANQGSVAQYMFSAIAANKTANSSALASAIDGVKVWVDQNSAVATKVTDLEATFTSATGTSSLASAVQSLIAMATDTSAVTQAVTDLKAQFTTALGTTSFSEALNKMSASANASGANAQAITDIQSTFTNKFGGASFAQAIDRLYTSIDQAGNSIAGWGLSLNSNGYVTGIQAINGGASNNYFKIVSSKFIIGDNNIDYVPFQVIDGKVQMHNVEVDTLKVNTAIIPTRVAASSGINGTYYTTGNNQPVATNTVLTTTINMPVAGYIEAQFVCKQSFNNGRLSDSPWAITIFIDGTPVTESTVWGTVPGDTPTTFAARYVDIGWHTVEVRWQAYSSITIQNRSLFVKGYPSTQ